MSTNWGDEANEEEQKIMDKVGLSALLTPVGVNAGYGML